MIHRFLLGKEERLNKKLIIQKLFNEGKVIKAFPLRFLVLSNTKQVEKPVQILISVPKKNFKNAVQRNLLKRRIKEAYRQNKNELHEILSTNNIQIALGIVYISDKISEYNVIEKKISRALAEIGAFLSE